MVSKKFDFGIEFVKFLSSLILSKLCIVLSTKLVYTRRTFELYRETAIDNFVRDFTFISSSELYKIKAYFYYPTFSVKRLYQILYGIGKPEMKYEKTESANAIYLTYRLSITVHGICATYNKILSYNNLSYFSHHPTLSLTKSYCP